MPSDLTLVQTISSQEEKIAGVRRQIEQAQELIDRSHKILEFEEGVLHGLKLVQGMNLPQMKTQERAPAVGPIPTEGSKPRVAIHHASVEPASPKKGRQPGAISHQWRDTLGQIYRIRAEGASDEEVAMAAQENGLPNIRPKDAAERMSAYVRHNYIEIVKGRNRVTDFAAEKYDFGPRPIPDGLFD